MTRPTEADARWERDGLVVEWLGGAVWIEVAGSGVLLDVPPGAVERLGDRLPRLRSVGLTSGRVRAVGGLVPLLVELSRWRTGEVPLALRFPLGEERGAMLAETWVRGWPDLYPLTLDAEVPGSTFDAGDAVVTTVPLRAGEPRWRDGTVQPVTAVALRVEVAGRRVSWVPAAAPDGALRRAVAGADLAVVEVGRVAWPRADTPWRPTVEDAVALRDVVGELWVVGDDGRLVGGPDH